MAIHQVSEILPVKGVELVGLLPEAIQNYTTYAGGISTKSPQAGPARSFIALLASPESAATTAVVSEVALSSFEQAPSRRTPASGTARNRRNFMRAA